METRLALATLDTFKDQIIHTDLLTLCRSLPPQSVDMVLCDLPYGSTACSWDEVIPFEPMWAGFKRVIKPRGAVVLFCLGLFGAKLKTSNMTDYKYDWIWEKTHSPHFLSATFRPLGIHEEIGVWNSGTYYPQKWNGEAKRNRSGSVLSDRKTTNFFDTPILKNVISFEYFPNTIIKIPSVRRADMQHPTQKPIALFEYLIKTYTLPGELVLDPCIGSGTTALACLNLDRHFIGGDITLEYVELARERLQKHDPTKAHEVAPGVKQLSLFDTVRV